MKALACLSFLCIVFFSNPSLAAQSTPQAVVADYVSDLTKGRLDAYFTYDWDYRFAAAKVKHDNPQALWPQKLQLLETAAHARLSASIGQVAYSGGFLGGMMLWDFVYEKQASATVLEVRQGPDDFLDLSVGGLGVVRGSTWEVFIKVQYPDKRTAPLYPQLQDSPALQEVVLKGRLWRLGPQLKPIGLAGFILNSSVEIVKDTLKIWPLDIPALSKAEVENPLREELKGSYGRIKIPVVWIGSQTKIPGNAPPEFAVKLVEVLREAGLAVSKVQQASKFDPWITIEYPEHPQGWKRYRLSGMGLFRYQYAEQLELSHTIRQQGKEAFVDYQYRWTGCTPICEFYKRVKALMEQHPGVTPAWLNAEDLQFVDNWAATPNAKFVWSKQEGWRWQRN